MKIFMILAILVSCVFTAKLHSSSRLLQATNATANATNATAVLTPVTNASSMNASMDLIPQNFFVDMNGKAGHDYIALKTNNGMFLRCDANGALAIQNNNIGKEELFVPVKVDSKLALRSYFGGYVGFNNNKFDCINRKLSADNLFDVDKKFDLASLKLKDITDKDMVLVLKMKDQYFANKDKVLSLMKDMSANVAWIASLKKADLTSLPQGKNYYENLTLPK